MTVLIAKNDYLFDNDKTDNFNILPKHRIELYYPSIIVSKPIFFSKYIKKLSETQRKNIENFWVYRASIEVALSKEVYWYFGIIELNPFYKIPVFSFESLNSYNSNWFEYRIEELSKREKLLRNFLFVNRNKI